MKRLIVSLAMLGLAGTAWAQDKTPEREKPVPPPIVVIEDDDDVEEEIPEDRRFGGAASVLVGPGYTAGNQPIDGRLSVRGETILAASEAAELGLVLPITVAAYSDEQDYSLDFRRTIIDVTPSLRGRIAPLALIHPYLDAGFGMAIFTRDVEGNYFGANDDDIANIAPVAHAALGAEIGRTTGDGGLVFILEPISVNDYILPGPDGLRFASMLGLGATF